MTERRQGGPPALVLAAGYGSRLAPVTDHIPKPLLPVRGRTLLDHAIAALDRAGVGTVVVNTHHLADQVAAHLAGRQDRERFIVSHEPEILGTGGALDGARVHLAGHPYFLIHNADVLCDADLRGLVANHEGSGAEATLLLVDWPAVNSVSLDGGGAITAIGPGQAGDRRLTYTGIGVFGPSILADIGAGFSSLIDPLVRALADRPGSIRGWAPAGLAWKDLGTLGRYLAEQGEEPDQGAGPGGRLTAITGHGSDRRFWRFKSGAWSAVAMLSGPDDQEFERGAEISAFLNAHGLGGAAVLHKDAAGHALLLEDVGAVNLLGLVRAKSPETPRVYQAVISRLLEIQARTPLALAECPAATDRLLDETVLLWETGYFKQRFLVGHMGLAEADMNGLDGEFARLARVVAAQPTVLLHRDFQSQNIHWHEGRVRLVDVQGMRMGPLGYDVMALLLDPYAELPAKLRDDLLDSWCRGAAALPESLGASVGEVHAMALAAGLQRIMQALGAYGFLGRVKGKTAFLDHIPAGLDRLRWLVAEVGRVGEVAPATDARLPGPLPVLEGLLDRLGSGKNALPLDGGDPDR